MFRSVRTTTGAWWTRRTGLPARPAVSENVSWSACPSRAQGTAAVPTGSRSTVSCSRTWTRARRRPTTRHYRRSAWPQAALPHPLITTTARSLNDRCHQAYLGRHHRPTQLPCSSPLWSRSRWSWSPAPAVPRPSTSPSPRTPPASLVTVPLRLTHCPRENMVISPRTATSQPPPPFPSFPPPQVYQPSTVSLLRFLFFPILSPSTGSLPCWRATRSWPTPCYSQCRARSLLPTCWRSSSPTPTCSRSTGAS